MYNNDLNTSMTEFLHNLCDDPEFHSLANKARAIDSYKNAKMHVNYKKISKYMSF